MDLKLLTWFAQVTRRTPHAAPTPHPRRTPHRRPHPTGHLTSRATWCLFAVGRAIRNGGGCAHRRGQEGRPPGALQEDGRAVAAR
eukprot:1290834-Prymnesium_polylepis.2